MLSADQGNADGQYVYGISLRDGSGVPIDLPRAAHYFKLAADQGNASAQNDCRIALRGGVGVPIDFGGAVK
jgi:TPR repeat protein